MPSCAGRVSRVHPAAYQDFHMSLASCIQVVLIADGQITAGAKVVKPNARKLRRLATEPQPSLGGFAGGWLLWTVQAWAQRLSWPDAV